MSWRRWILRGVGGLLSGLIRLKAKGSTRWKVLLTSTLLASAEYLVRPASQENDQ